MKLKTLPLVVLMSIGATGSALADDYKCGNSDPTTWMSKKAIAQKAAKLGYKTQKIEIDDGCYEIEGTKNGQRFELTLNPVSGMLVELERD